MIHLMFNWLWQKIKNNYLFLFFLILGLVFRSHNWQSYYLGFDQVQILTNAEKILLGKLTLIGPRTGPADTFTGPLIYYLAVPLIAILGSIKTAVFLPLILSALTALTLYYLANYYLDKKTASIITTIWSIAPILINLDRIFWNPNLALMAFSLIFWPLFFAKKIKKNDLFLIALGSFLSYQAHFSAFLVPVLVFSISIIYRRPKKLFLASIIGLMISFLPTLIFDLRHDFLNIKGMWHLINAENSNFSINNFFQNFYQNILINLEVYCQLFYRGRNTIIRVYTGLSILILSFLIEKDKKLFLKITLWPFLIIFFMSFYQGNIPEYYFLISLPAYIYLLANTLKNFNRYLIIIFLIFILFNSYNYLNKIIVDQNEELSLGNSLAIKDEILLIKQNRDIAEIRYLLPHASDFGLKYLIEPLNLTKESGIKVNIIYGAQEDYPAVARYGRTLIEIEE